MSEPLRFLSYGGGTQSAALALMSAAGELERLDAVIFADTGGELPATYEYAAYVAERLEAAGIPFLRVTAGNLERATLGLERNSTGGGPPILPAHVAGADGAAGKVRGYTCSYDYKRRPVARETKRLVGPRGAWKREGRVVEQWLGFSVDEVGRAKPETMCRCGHVRGTHAAGPCGNARCSCAAFSAWRVNRFPLLELGYRRGDTIRWFAANGHPTPPRSACWFCPNQGDARWRELRDKHPQLWARACLIDDAQRGADVVNAALVDGGAKYLHRQRVPLPLVDLRSATERRADAGELPLFDEDELAHDCAAGVCFT